MTNPAAGRSALGRMVSGDEADALQVTTAEEPAFGALYYLQVGITWPGLIALELKGHVPQLSFESFPAFVEGAGKRAQLLGEVGSSAPENWIGGLGEGEDHVLFTLFAMPPCSARLSAVCSTEGAFQELWRGDGAALIETVNGIATPVAKVHFGYVDGRADLTIKGGLEGNIPDHQ